PTTSSRSTVGTATEIYDFLRLLRARTGTQHCVKCGSVVKVDTVQEVVDALVDVGAQHAAPLPILMTFPLPASAHRPDVEVAAQLRAAGFVRAQLDGVLARLDPPDAEQRVREAQEVLVVVDRLPASDATRGRLADAVATAFNEARGLPSRSTTATAVAFRLIPRARTAARPRPRSRRSCFRSTTRGVPAPGATASAPSWSTTNRSSCPNPGRASRRARWIRGPSRAMRAAVASCARPRGPRA